MTTPLTAPRHRFVPAEEPVEPSAEIRREAGLDEQGRRRLGAERLAEILDHARTRVPAYAAISRRDVADRGVLAFPVVTKADLRAGADRLSVADRPVRWNRTSGSTNTPLRTPLGPRHERNQVVRWLRHWRTFGVDRPGTFTFLVPKAYRLRRFGGGDLRDLAGGHLVRQRCPGDRPDPLEHPVVANPHVLEQLYPDGWDWDCPALVTSYEQRPADLHRWRAAVHGDVYGLSEVGDIAWQRVGEGHWALHEDLVMAEIADGHRDGGRTVGELVVTDLTNRVMPLIRYRTGDVVAGECDERGRLLRLTSVVGRRIRTAGTPLAGVDVMSSVLPSLLELDGPFRVTADANRVRVHVHSGPSERDGLLLRLRRSLPDVPWEVTAEPAGPGLADVFAAPAPPAPGCRCVAAPAAVSTVDGVRGCSSGAGRRILCLPPGPGFGHQLVRALHDVLAGLGEVRLVDYPGHGYGRTPAGLDELADTVAAATRQDDILLGHSWGARIAAAVAARAPVAGLVMLSPPPATRAPRQWNADTAELRRWRRDGLDADAWYRRYLAEHALPLGFGGDRDRARALLAGVSTHEPVWRVLRGESPVFDLDAALGAVHCPVLVATGADDALGDPAAVHAAAEDRACVRHVVLPGGHYPYLDRPDAVRRAVAGFAGGAGDD